MNLADDTTATVAVVGLVAAAVGGIVKWLRRLLGVRLTRAEQDRRLTEIWRAIRLDDPYDNLPATVARLASTVENLTASVDQLVSTQREPPPSRAGEGGDGARIVHPL